MINCVENRGEVIEVVPTLLPNAPALLQSSLHITTAIRRLITVIIHAGLAGGKKMWNIAPVSSLNGKWPFPTPEERTYVRIRTPVLAPSRSWKLRSR
jgi:hypothetical protein